MNPPNGYPTIIARVRPPAGWQLYYQDDHQPIVPVPGIHIHKLLADSFTTVLTEIWAYAKEALGAGATDDAIRQWLHQTRVDQTGDGHNYRPNTSNPMHVQFATGA